jgi:hypothetical protein
MTKREPDPARTLKFNTDNAISAYQVLQNAAIRLDEADYHLDQCIAMGIDMDRYYEATGRMDQEFEVKRRRLAKAGRLPRD